MPRQPIKKRTIGSAVDEAADALISGPAGAPGRLADEAGRWKQIGSQVASKAVRFGRGIGKIASQGFKSISDKGTAAGGDTSDVKMGAGFDSALAEAQTKNANSQYKRAKK